MNKRPSELMMLCTQTASQLRSLRSEQFEAESKVELQKHLEWLEKSKMLVEEEVVGEDEEQKSGSEGKKKVPRPMNSFMVFSHLERKRLAEENPELHNADLSKILGRKWKTLSPAQRQPYIDEAERLRVLHTETFPDYKYKPRRRKHPKRNTKKFSTLSANDVNMKTKLALDLDCTLPAMVNHPMSARVIPKNPVSPTPSLEHASPVAVTVNFDAIFDNPAIPPTPSDSPLANSDAQEIDIQPVESLQPLPCTTEGITTFYTFLPPTPELSPQVTTTVNRAAFSFDHIQSNDVLVKTENVFQTSCIIPSSMTEATKKNFTAASTCLPMISNFGTIYSTQEEEEPQTTTRDEGQLFGDVDRDEFDQYLGASLEKSHLNDSLRNIIAELEDNLKNNENS